MSRRATGAAAENEGIARESITPIYLQRGLTLCILAHPLAPRASLQLF